MVILRTGIVLAKEASVAGLGWALANSGSGRPGAAAQTPEMWPCSRSAVCRPPALLPYCAGRRTGSHGPSVPDLCGWAAGQRAAVVQLDPPVSGLGR